MMQRSSYRSIFFEPDWIHGKFYGWKAIVEKPDFRVLLKQFGPIRRYLVLSNLGRDQLCDEVRDLCLFSWLSTVTIKDFTELNLDSRNELKLVGKSVPQASEEHRIYNRYTFVVDLTQNLDSIWSNMKPDNKRVCRKSMDVGMTVECISSASSCITALFFERYRKMALERSLVVPSEKIIMKMFSNGHLRVFFSRSLNAVGSIILIYTAGKKAFYLYGVPSERVNDGSGQLEQWKAMEHLRESGYHWYDLGGVPAINGKNGIYRFKMSLGGDLVDLGSEYYYCPSLLGWMKRVYKKFRLAL